MVVHRGQRALEETARLLQKHGRASPVQASHTLEIKLHGIGMRRLFRATRFGDNKLHA
jgi:hypothetical protein